LDGIELPQNEILRDLCSRRHALAAVMHANDNGRASLLSHCLRLKIGHVRKTDIHKMEEHAGITHKELVTKPQLIGHGIGYEWTGRGDGARCTPMLYPIHKSLEEIHEVPPGGWPDRCAYLNGDGVQCLYTQSLCPFPHHRPAI
jgi:hypothetical protein